MPARATIVILALLTSPSASAACGAKTETARRSGKRTLDLDFYTNPDTTGSDMAQEGGFFKEAG